jgi:hypothetical protein
MKKLFFAVFICWSIASCAQFVHPGMLHGKADLEFMKSMVKSGQEPWKSAWNEMKKSKLASLTLKPRPVPNVHCGPYNKPNIGGTEFYHDGNFAYTMSLLWYVSGEEKYAKKAIEILNAWSYTLDSVTNSNQKLKVGVAGIKYLNAAEIIRHTYGKWEEKDLRQFERMVMEVWYPVVDGFRPKTNGNWDAAIAQTLMCIGIYMDRQDIFDRTCDHLLNGQTNGAIKYYFSETGQCQESGRDQGHTQMGMSYLCNACEIAWNQGRDLYAAAGNRLMLGYEYTSKYMLGEDVPYVKYKTWYGKTVYGDAIGNGGRGRFSPIYERAYHHYHDRMGLEMPYTRRVVDRIRNEGDQSGFIPWSTLTAARQIKK